MKRSKFLLTAQFVSDKFADGGYPFTLVKKDGENLCIACGRKEFPRLLTGTARDGWGIEGREINWGGESLFCAHCNDKIPSAYRDDE